MKTKTILLLAIFLGLIGIKSQQIFDEVFTGTSLPTGWSISSTATNATEKWAFYSDYDDLEVYESTTVAQNEWVYMPKVSLQTYGEAYLNFGLWMYNKSSWATNRSCRASVHASINNGATWTEIWSTDQITASDFLGEALYSRFWNINLASYCGAGKPDVKIAYQYTSNKLKNNTLTSFAAIIRVNIAGQPLVSFIKLNKNTITWHPVNDFNGTYEIYYGPIGTTTEKGGGTLVTGLTGTSFTIPTSFCQYVAFIRAKNVLPGEWLKLSYLNSITSIIATPDTTSALLSWNGDADTYDLEYGVGNFVQGSGTRINNISSNTNYNLTNLQPSTSYKVYIKATCNTANWASKTFQTLVLGTDSAEKLQLSIYPNPTKNSLNFSLPLKNIEITDISGKAIKSIKNSTTIIDISELPPGVYMLSGTNNSDAKVTSKIIKE
ncbi:MAG: T9SS type A sorting domain-containing protein [Kaistella sp.]